MQNSCGRLILFSLFLFLGYHAEAVAQDASHPKPKTSAGTGSASASASQQSVSRGVTAIINEQQTAWNRGDVDAFMQGYWNSPDVTYAGANGITRGWQPVVERFRKVYPNQEAMGHLDFSELEVHPLGKDAALVLGRWHLKRSADDLGGVFSLVFQRFPEGWRIIHDHTSQDAKKP